MAVSLETLVLVSCLGIVLVLITKVLVLVLVLTYEVLILGLYLVDLVDLLLS